MRIGRIVKNLMCIGMALTFISLAAPYTPSYAQKRLQKPEVVLPGHYPDGFDGWGYLELVSGTGVVIADRLFKLAPQADFHTPEDRIATIYSFKVGDMVGFMMNERKEIVSLWLIQ